ncbi:hypothetical protein QBC47DRAFT_392344 [Echria macrotheca]|uniref:Uncharacterized protein n=1 Tax=Echria macrotheca TaxID=438768 RepID=A0AAJ0B409_9PEZI|nr:hypothetical protein QBC47DRAFT_392344 [Echria macrotheca]
MKYSLILSLAGLATALNTPSIAVSGVSGKHVSRAPERPAGAPEGYEMYVAVPTEYRSADGLLPLPDNIQRRYESLQALRRLRRQASAQDFYECANAVRPPADSPGQNLLLTHLQQTPAPVSSDCGVIVNNVLATGNDLIVDRGSCLVFSYRSCTGFFCSLCAQLTTSTDFIGSQLDSVDALCVSNNQAGTIVGEGAPQYQVGFIRAGNGLPNYDVCK